MDLAAPDAQTALAYAESLLLQRDINGAHKAFETAVELGANQDAVCGSLWQLHMIAGNFEGAWRQSDLLRARNAPDEHRFWTGEPIDGKHIIVRSLHGFGDAVQMLRYAPMMRARAASVLYEVPPRLYAIAQYFAGVEKVITWGDEAPATPPAFDLQLEIMELPYLHRTLMVDLPIATSYLQPPGRKVSRTAGGPQIGIVWSAGSWNPSRSVPLKLLEPVLTSGRFEFFNLQGQGSAGEADPLKLSGVEDGILPLAERIRQLDLVITVDTLAAHLAGAMSIPCWLLLQHAGDWRWLHERADSPWYPSLTIFRQPGPGNWAAVIAQVQQRLATLDR